MESWTVITSTESGVNSWEQKPYHEGKPWNKNYEGKPWNKNYEGKPEWTNKYESLKPEWTKYESIKPEWTNKYESLKPEWYKNYEGKPEWTNKYESLKPEWTNKYESIKPEWTNKYESIKPEWINKYESVKPEWYKNWEGKSEWMNKYESLKPEGKQWYKNVDGEMKPEWKYGKREQKPYYAVEVCGDWEKICEGLERVQLEQPCGGRFYENKSRWSCKGQGCCDEEMIKMVKNLITVLVGAEQSYEQLGFLCMDERFTLTNTSEYFRLCGLRMRWLANGLIRRSNRLFNVHEWINNTKFENWFKVPTKDELSTNDYTGVMKTLFKIVIEAEKRLVEKMEILGEKMVHSDWAMNTECRFDGFKWFINFVLPYQTNFLREMLMHWNTIQMCNNGYIFDKCEMQPLVIKIEEFIHNLVKINEVQPITYRRNL